MFRILCKRAVNEWSRATRTINSTLRAVLSPARGMPSGVAVGFLTDIARSRRELLAENAFLRQQLLVAARSVKKPRVRAFDRVLLVALAALFPTETSERGRSVRPEVTDAEGGTATDEKAVVALEPSVPPIVVLTPPVRYVVDASGVVAEQIAVSAAGSWDPDNVAAGQPFAPGVGVRTYAWKVWPPLGCPAQAVASGDPTLVLFAAGAVVPPTCQGTWWVGVTVGDDDAPPRSASVATQVIIGNGVGSVCIDAPKTSAPRVVDNWNLTDVTVVYHLDSALYDDPAFQYGMFTELEVVEEASGRVVHLAFDPNVLASERGALLTFNWNGWDDLGLPVAPGFYGVRVSLVDAMGSTTPFASAEPSSIWIEVASVEGSIVGGEYVDREALPFVRNGPDPDHFAARDWQRFALRVQDPGANADPGASEQIGAAGALTVATSVGAAPLDSATPVIATETAASSGTFVSRTHLLTTLDANLPRLVPDDDYAAEDDAFAAHDGSPGAGLVPDQQLGDRTHTASLLGSVSVRYDVAGATPVSMDLPVCPRTGPRQRAFISLQPIVFDVLDEGTGTRGPVVSAAYVEAELTRAAIAWQQACIEVRARPIRWEPAPLDDLGVPMLDDQVFSDKDELLLQQTRFATDAQPDVVYVFFVEPFQVDVLGRSRTPRNGVDYVFAYIRSGLRHDERALAHEIGHGLENLDRDPRGDPSLVKPQQFYPTAYIQGSSDRYVNMLRRIDPQTDANARLRRVSRTDPGNVLLQPF